MHARLLEQLKQSTKLFADETTAPVLDPGRGCTKKGQLWAYARDERPWAGRAPPGVAYVYAPDRKHARPAEHLAGFSGTLQVDGTPSGLEQARTPAGALTCAPSPEGGACRRAGQRASTRQCAALRCRQGHRGSPMRLRKLLRYLSLIFLALALAPKYWLATSAQENADLVPRLGETSAEFEARARGLARPAPTEPISVTLAPDPQGHFFVEPIVNGTRLRMMIDTGASLVVLSREDARHIGINPATGDFTMPAATANGVVLVAPVVLKEVAIGEVAVRDVPAAVFPDNKLQVGLLGMSFLSKLSHFEVAGGQLVLKR